MLFTENQLGFTTPLSLLDSLFQISETESIEQAIMIPVCENKRLDAWTVRSNDVIKLAESSSLTYMDALAVIAEANQLDPSQAVVTIEEADIWEDPELVREFSHIVVSPISELDPIYMMYEMAIDTYTDTEDDSLFDFILNEIGGGMGGSFAGTMLRHMATDAAKLDRNPIKAYQKVKDLGEMPTRWGWDQNSLVRNIAFFKHPVIQAILGHKGSDGMQRYQSAIASFAREAGSTPESAKKNAIEMVMNGITKGMNPSGLDPFESRYPNLSRKSKMIKVRSWAKKVGDAVEKYHPDNANRSENGKSHTFRNVAIAGAGIAGVASLVKGIQAYRDKPKSVIGRKIAALRQIYKKYLDQAHRFPEKAGIFKKIASKILGAIDQLLGFLQRKAG